MTPATTSELRRLLTLVAAWQDAPTGGEEVEAVVSLEEFNVDGATEQLRGLIDERDSLSQENAALRDNNRSLKHLFDVKCAEKVQAE